LASTDDTGWYRWDGSQLVLQLVIQPKASHTAFCDVRNGRLKVRLTAAPSDGAANRCLIEFLADQFGVAKNAVDLIRGASSRQKTVAIDHPAILPGTLDIRSQS